MLNLIVIINYTIKITKYKFSNLILIKRTTIYNIIYYMYCDMLYKNMKNSYNNYYKFNLNEVIESNPCKLLSDPIL